jgi:hypothetical protein
MKAPFPQTTWPLLTAPAALLLAALAALGLSPQFSTFALLPVAILAAPALLLTLWRPPCALIIGVLIPLLQVQSGRTTLAWGASLLLVVASARSWPNTGRKQRRLALLVALLGLGTLATGLGLAGPLAENGVLFAVVYATVASVAAAVIRPSGTTVAFIMCCPGTVITLVCLFGSNMSTDRRSMVLGENANGVGFLAAIGLVAGLTLIGRSTKTIAGFGFTAAFICTVGVAVSASRGALLAAVGGVAALVLARVIASRWTWATLACAGVTGLLIITAGPVSHLFVEYAGRPSDRAQASYDAREFMVGYAIEQGLSHPLLGVGLGRLADVSVADPESRVMLRAHNAFAGVFAESGLVVLALLLAVCLAAFLSARKYDARRLLPLVTVVVVTGFSLEWWGAGSTGAAAMLILGSALGLGMAQPRTRSGAQPPGAEHDPSVVFGPAKWGEW